MAQAILRRPTIVRYQLDADGDATTLTYTHSRRGVRGRLTPGQALGRVFREGRPAGQSSGSQWKRAG